MFYRQEIPGNTSNFFLHKTKQRSPSLLCKIQTNEMKEVLVKALQKGVCDGTVKQNLDVLVETMIRRFKGFIQSIPTYSNRQYVIDSLSEKCFEQGLDMFLAYIKSK